MLVARHYKLLQTLPIYANHLFQSILHLRISVMSLSGIAEEEHKLNIAPITMSFRFRPALRSPIAALAACCALLGGVAMAAPSEQAQRRDDGPRGQQGQLVPAQPAQPAPRDAGRYESRRGGERMAEPRQPEPQRAPDGRADEQRRAAQGGDAGRRNGRLTPDERRDLRRQINEAGQDIYAAPLRR